MPQGLLLGPLLFILYINDITSFVNISNIRLFADDTCLYIDVDNRIDAAIRIENDLVNIKRWAKLWLVDLPPEKITHCK